MGAPHSDSRATPPSRVSTQKHLQLTTSGSINMAPLYPAFAVNASGHLEVSPIHSIYYEECGNPKGVPIVYLHGGPGGGIEESDRWDTTLSIVYKQSTNCGITGDISIPPITAASSSTNVAPENPPLMPALKTTQLGLSSPTSKPCANT